MFGIIEKGEFRQPPRKLLNVPRTFAGEDGNPVVGIYNVGYDPAKEPEPEVVDYLLDLGYLPVIEAERPEDGDSYHYIDKYELDGNHITQMWERAEDEPVESESTLREDLMYLTGGM